MKMIKRITAFLCAAALALPALSAAGINANAATNVTLSPESIYPINDGVFEGWGTSLCWWANRVGYSDSLAQQTADAFYGPDGLRLNIARFNIGGGDNPDHHHITRTDSNMPGYTNWNGSSATYDWSKDANQRNVLLRAIKACGDDMIVEMFSNSPPYYMCKSGCSTGNQNPGANNLKDDCYDDFAEYLAEVCDHYEKVWGVKVQSVEAFNEPYTNFWGANSAKQEGCHFDIGNSESTMIMELQKSMRKRGLNDVLIVGTDETSIDTQIDAFNKLSGDAKNAISRIDTHTYGGYKREELRNTAIAAGKNLWMSEVDGGSTAGTNAGEMGSALWLAERINIDMNGLNPSAWIIWQVIDNHISSVGMNGNKDKGMVNTQGGFWGCCVADHDNNKIIYTKKYYAFGQYTRYIRPGMIMLRSGSNVVAAYDPAAGQVVIVAFNKDGNSSDLNVDLSAFQSVGETAQVIRTSNSENWKELSPVALNGTRLSTSLAGHSVTTFIIDGCGGNAGTGLQLEESQLSGSDAWNNGSENDYRKAFDGDTSTYFDGVGAGWVQADLGAVYELSSIAYCPRKSYEYRMTDGYFEVSTDGVNWKTVHTVTSKPTFGMHTVRLKSDDAKARYVRYAVPEGRPQNSDNPDDVYCCNIAEIRINGKLSVKDNFDKLTPVATSGSNSWKDQADYNYTKAFDGSTGTFFDGVGAGWVQADLGESYDLRAIGYAARSGYEPRMVDGYFEVSEDGQNWQKVYTVSGTPSSSMQYTILPEGQTARYVRYAVPDGKPNNGVNSDDVYCCNVAELEFYGLPVSIVVPPLAGDLNTDGAADLIDLITLQKFIHGIGELPDEAAADLMQDGVIDVFDLAMLKWLLLRK
ncbi:MAG: discoidin domain-containing protein [Oscillospiraceae bacterium]|nr:discoidin domain-containing protein [Oscillospiraceae bacterium]